MSFPTASRIRPARQPLPAPSSGQIVSQRIFAMDSDSDSQIDTIMRNGPFSGSSPCSGACTCPCNASLSSMCWMTSEPPFKIAKPQRTSASEILYRSYSVQVQDHNMDHRKNLSPLRQLCSGYTCLIVWWGRSGFHGRECKVQRKAS